MYSVNEHRYVPNVWMPQNARNPILSPTSHTFLSRPTGQTLLDDTSTAAQPPSTKALPHVHTAAQPSKENMAVSNCSFPGCLLLLH